LTSLSPPPLASTPGDQAETIRFDAIADALAAVRNGESIVVVDDENRKTKAT
jgi:3,4-dihydroxy 2-butanone 4-phosphate synthase / GTP cyclohydrolase II